MNHKKKLYIIADITLIDFKFRAPKTRKKLFGPTLKHVKPRTKTIYSTESEVLDFAVLSLLGWIVSCIYTQTTPKGTLFREDNHHFGLPVERNCPYCPHSVFKKRQPNNNLVSRDFCFLLLPVTPLKVSPSWISPLTQSRSILSLHPSSSQPEISGMLAALSNANFIYVVSSSYLCYLMRLRHFLYFSEPRVSPEFPYY